MGRNFDGAFTQAWVTGFATSVATTQDELTEMDQQAGDGDFGVNLLEGLGAAKQRLEQLPAEGPEDATEPLQILASVFLDQVGGTSGPLFGLLFHELAAAVRTTGPQLTTGALAVGTREGLAAIQRVGDASPGDKTLVDALAPASEALARDDQAGTPPDAALSAAAEAAWQGVHSTLQLRARQGRASYLGARASGVPDPGAVGIALLFTSAGQAVTGLAPLLEEPGAAAR